MQRFGQIMLGLALPLGALAQPGATGVLSGALSYPGEGIPVLRVCAFSTADKSVYRCVTTKKNQTTYRIGGLNPGTYFVVAYPDPLDSGITNPDPGGYSKAVLCGLRHGCNDHELVAVEVKAGEVTRGIDPADWYAPANTFPPEPGK